MEIFEVNQKEYNQVISNPYHNFATSEFNNLNSNKCESIHFLLFKEDKYKLGIIGGICNDKFYSPFSAPFGGFSFVNNNTGIEYIDRAVELLIEWSTIKNLDGIYLTLPPAIYDHSFVNKQINCLYRKNFNIEKLELNYTYLIKNFDEEYINNIWKNARNNLRKAFKQDLKFIRCENIGDKKKSFEIIEQHKKIKGYPLRMSWELIVQTISIIEADFFLVLDVDHTPVASSMVFWITEKIVQIIYWGDVQEYSHYRTMNFLSYKIFEYYSLKGIEIVDLGPSSENSVPNLGLGSFKESIGCEILTKISFELDLKNELRLSENKQKNIMIHPSSDVQSPNIGENTQIWQYCVVLPNAVIGRNCNINCNVFIENDVIIGNNVTIKSGVQVWDGIIIEDDVFIGPNVTLTNDLFPRSKRNIIPFKKTIFKKGASVGANATVLAGNTIGSYAMIGAGAIITKDIPDYELWVGAPAKHVGYVSESGDVLDMELKSRKTDKKYFWKNNVLKEELNPIIIAEGIKMRLIEKSDAKFILNLRTDEKLRQYISPTSPSLDDQTTWIEDYKKRESNEEEYYFIFEDTYHKQWGVIRLYNIINESFTTGSWICLPGNNENIAVKAFLLAVEFGFEKLNYKTCLLDVRKKNLYVLYFMKLFGPVLIKEDEQNYFFELNRISFYKNREKVLNLIKFIIKHD